ncbi:hypothetical protein SETIT_4G196600v2 [Setaria italica]|uniref:Uncharacterized protein n=1 Tax=Setaria italica TaxID=4555 RepID=A0A368QVZ3_SETIT|nr:hypothetical protein SETIT_4G196600v2 [Setaria italica]
MATGTVASLLGGSTSPWSRLQRLSQLLALKPCAAHPRRCKRQHAIGLAHCTFLKEFVGPTYMTFLLKFSFLSGPRSRFRPAAARSSSSRSAASPQAPATSAALFFLLLWRREPGPFSSGCPTPCLPAPSPPHPGRWQPELTRIRRPSRSQLCLRDDAEIVGLHYDAAASSSASVNDASSDSLSFGGAHPARCRPAAPPPAVRDAAASPTPICTPQSRSSAADRPRLRPRVAAA